MLSLPAFALPRSRSAHPQGATRAFTLIELLMVIALIGVLAAITLSVVRGVKERASMGQAKTELAVLATALESYKRQYGDYPQIVADEPANLLQALIGRKTPRMSEMTGKSFIEVGRFALFDPAEDSVVTGSAKDPATDTSLYLSDPWDKAYRYFYYTKTDPGTGITRRGYVLYSSGPDGQHAQPTGGEINDDAAGNADNLYANR